MWGGSLATQQSPGRLSGIPSRRSVENTRAKSGGSGGGSCCWEGDGVKGTPLTLALLAAGTLHVGRRRACWALRGRAGDGLALHRAVLVKTEGETGC